MADNMEPSRPGSRARPGAEIGRAGPFASAAGMNAAPLPVSGPDGNRHRSMTKTTARGSRPTVTPSGQSRPGGLDLGFVRDFLQTLADNLSPVSPDNILGFPSFMHQDEGSLFLTDQEARQYRRTVTRLHRILAPNDDLSESTINAALRSAVFESLDLQDRRGGDTGVQT